MDHFRRGLRGKVRHTSLGEDDELAPFPEQVEERFEAWLLHQQNSGRTFTAEQRDWLRLIRDHLAASLSIELRELLDAPFSQRGGLGRARELFGQDLDALLAELTGIVAA